MQPIAIQKYIGILDFFKSTFVQDFTSKHTAGIFIHVFFLSLMYIKECARNWILITIKTCQRT